MAGLGDVCVGEIFLRGDHGSIYVSLSNVCEINVGIGRAASVRWFIAENILDL